MPSDAPADPSRRRLLRGTAGLTAAAGLSYVGATRALMAQPAPAPAARDSVRFINEFRIYGGTAPVIYGIEKGYFRELGIDATTDGSSGSADAVAKVASGAYSFGMADISTLVEFTSRNPQAAPRLLMPVYDRVSAAIMSFKKFGITSFKGLEGHLLGTATADSGSRILPVLLALQKVDPATIQRKTIDVALRDTMLLRGQVDAVIGNDYTTLFNLMGQGVQPEEINLVYYADNGFDFYGQGVIAHPSMVEQKPDLVKRMVLGITQSWLGAGKNPKEAVDAVLKRDPLLDPKIELARLNWVLEHLVLTANARAHGFGTMDLDRFRRGLAILAEGFQLPSPPTVEQIYDPRFTPEASLRRVI